MDTGGKVYIAANGDSNLRSLEELSKPVAAISSNYELLTKRIRFFASPRLAASYPRDERRSERLFLQSAIKDLKAITIRSQVA